MEQNQITPPVIQQSMPQTRQEPELTPHKSNLNKILLGLLVLAIIVVGIGIYIWRDSQANLSKRNNETKLNELKDRLSKVETSAIVTQVVHNPTSRADTTTALDNAQSAQNVAEVYAAEFNRYPTLTTDFINGSGIVKLPSNITPSISNPTAENGKTTFRWEYVGNALAPIGGRITYWDYVNDRISTNIIYVGAATANSIFVTPAS